MIVVARVKKMKDGIVLMKLSRKLDRITYSKVARMIQENEKAKRVVCDPYLKKEDGVYLIEIEDHNVKIDSVIL